MRAAFKRSKTNNIYCRLGFYRLFKPSKMPKWNEKKRNYISES